MRRFVVCIVGLSLVACGGSSGRLVPLAVLQDGCERTLGWNGSACTDDGAAHKTLARAVDALDGFDVDTALSLLTQTLDSGPHGHALLVSLYEKLAITYAYLKREEAALAAFERLLTLDPGHLLSYTLSPQATFLFERVRRANESKRTAQIDVRWPQGGKENDPVVLSVEVIADPQHSLHSMALHVRDSKASSYRRVQFSLPKDGGVRQVVLPPLATERESLLQIYGSAFDREGNEVLLWSDSKHPREVPLGYTPPSPWYRKWWVWTTIGSAVAVGTGTAVYWLGLPEPKSVQGGFQVAR